MLSLTARPGLRGLGSFIKTRNSNAASNLRCPSCDLSNLSTRGARGRCRHVPCTCGKRAERGRGRSACMRGVEFRVSAPSPDPVETEGSSGRGRGARVGSREGEKERRARGGDGGERSRGWEGCVPRFGSSRWHPNCRSRPSPASERERAAARRRVVAARPEGESGVRLPPLSRRLWSVGRVGPGSVGLACCGGRPTAWYVPCAREEFGSREVIPCRGTSFLLSLLLACLSVPKVPV